MSCTASHSTVQHSTPLKVPVYLSAIIWTRLCPQLVPYEYFTPSLFSCTSRARSFYPHLEKKRLGPHTQHANSLMGRRALLVLILLRLNLPLFFFFFSTQSLTGRALRPSDPDSYCPPALCSYQGRIWPHYRYKAQRDPQLVTGLVEERAAAGSHLTPRNARRTRAGGARVQSTTLSGQISLAICSKFIHG